MLQTGQNRIRDLDISQNLTELLPELFLTHIR